MGDHKASDMVPNKNMRHVVSQKHCNFQGGGLCLVPPVVWTCKTTSIEGKATELLQTSVALKVSENTGPLYDVLEDTVTYAVLLPLKVPEVPD